MAAVIPLDLFDKKHLIQYDGMFLTRVSHSAVHKVGHTTTKSSSDGMPPSYMPSLCRRTATPPTGVAPITANTAVKRPHNCKCEVRTHDVRTCITGLGLAVEHPMAVARVTGHVHRPGKKAPLPGGVARKWRVWEGDYGS